MSSPQVQEFVRNLEKVSGNAHCVASEQAAAEKVADLLRALSPKVLALGLQPQAVLDAVRAFAAESGCTVLGPEYAAADLPMAMDPAQIGITFADFGIAETGTVVEVVTNDAYRLVSAMPRTHIAIVNAWDFVPTLRESAARMREVFERHEGHVAVSYISGPSRTGDIEMILTLGVHGPETVHVIVIEGET